MLLSVSDLGRAPPHTQCATDQLPGAVKWRISKPPHDGNSAAENELRGFTEVRIGLCVAAKSLSSLSPALPALKHWPPVGWHCR
mmetsp:Transcript_13135/g.24206  ORF Transcript_13135/g.24206 Transcript_13135/m.24206 type:complete len:84 (-) Transcript_13135:1460-1711(-)